LGLAGCGILREAMREAVDACGTGSGSSRLICGSLGAHHELERTIAELKGTQAALCFSSGYAAATGTLGALLQKGDVVILDKLCHASLIDGARLSGAALRIYPHNHLEKLESHLLWAAQRISGSGRTLVVTESVFSMDGDRAPLEGIVRLVEDHGAMLLVDEAHAFGILGPGGRGLAAELGIQHGIHLQMGTFSKAVGVSGGFVCADRALVRLLVNRARSFIYSTAPPPAVAATATAALRLIEGHEGERRRKQLWENIALLRQTLGETAAPAQSAILPWRVGGEDRALAAAASLREEGLLVPAIRYPTVARGSARLRIALSANHDRAQIETLATALRKIGGS
ncbi:MAG: aminotransferase class I/II-fold pyridoxal phosphate-dependent enzyme, partial [Verrucomicrobiales bacterium]